MIAPGLLMKRAVPFALAIGIWFTPVPAGLTAQSWHLFAAFAAAIVSVLVGAFPLLHASMIAVAAVVLTGTLTPAQAFSGFANSSVLLVMVAFIVAQAVVKSGLGRRISLFMVSLFGGSSLGLAYSIVLTDAAIAPAFPSNTARGGVLFPIVLSVAKGAGSNPDDPEGRRLGGYLMFCGMASLAVSSALWMTATSANPVGVQIAQKFGVEIGFGSWILASCVPALIAIGMLPLLVAKLFPPRVGKTPEAPAAARAELASMGKLSRDERITAVIFAVMVAGWVFAGALNLNITSIAFMGFGVLLVTGVLTVEDIDIRGDTLATFLWLAVLFAMSGQLNELGFMGYVGERLASRLGGLSWPATYATLIVLYVGIHYLFVSQTSQVLALFGVFLDVGIRGGVPAPLMAFGLLFGGLRPQLRRGACDAGASVPVPGRRNQETPRPEDQGVLHRQPRQPVRGGALSRHDQEDRGGAQEAPGSHSADGRRVRHLRAGFPFADGGVPEEHHRRLLVQQVLRLHRLAPRHGRGARGQHLRRDDREASRDHQEEAGQALRRAHARTAQARVHRPHRGGQPRRRAESHRGPVASAAGHDDAVLARRADGREEGLPEGLHRHRQEAGRGDTRGAGPRSFLRTSTSTGTTA